MPSLLDSITERLTPDVVTRVATQLGEPESGIARALPTATTAVLASLASKTSDAGVMRQVFDLVTNRDNDAASADDLGATVARAMTAGSATTSLGTSLLSTVLGGRANDVGTAIARATGLTKSSSGSSLLALAAPIVLAFLRSRVRQGNLNLAGFTRLLGAERDSVAAAVPPGLRGFLDLGPTPSVIPRVDASRDQAVARSRGGVEEPRGNRWLWPVIGGLAAAGLLWALFGRGRTPEPVTTALDSAAAVSRTAVDSTVAAGQRTFDTAAGAVSGAVRDLGAMVKRALPGGVTLDIPERGIESKLVAFIEDSSRPVNDTTWFEFDRLNFASGSATILPESQRLAAAVSRAG